MKTVTKILAFLFVVTIFMACGPKPQYKTSVGKKKLKYYNSIQYDKKDNSPKTFKSFKQR